MKQYKFLRLVGDRVVSDYDHAIEWRIGVTVEVPAPTAQCFGLNSCRYIPDAWGYVAGEILAQVECGGQRVRSGDKDTWQRQMPVRMWRVPTEYDKATAAARTQRDEATAAAWAQYDEATAAAWVQYDKATAPAWAQYDEATAAAWAQYDKATAAAWVQYDKATAAARTQRDEATAPARAQCHRACRDIICTAENEMTP